GCASLHGTDPDALAADLTYLYHNHLAPPAVRPRALPHRYVEMRRIAPGAIDSKRVQAQLPPLVKGYLRLGGFIGDGAVIDQQFNTTDVAVVVKTDLVTDKYYRHYERQLRDALDRGEIVWEVGPKVGSEKFPFHNRLPGIIAALIIYIPVN